MYVYLNLCTAEHDHLIIYLLTGCNHSLPPRLRGRQRHLSVAGGNCSSFANRQLGVKRRGARHGEGREAEGMGVGVGLGSRGCARLRESSYQSTPEPRKYMS